MSNLTSVGISSGVPNSGTGTVSTIDALMADGGQATIGTKADAKSTATDTTAVTAMSVWKQISASVQALTAIIDSGALNVFIDPTSVNANGQATMANSAPVALASDQSAIPLKGDVAHDAADSGNPAKIGAKAIAGLSTATLVSAADRTQVYAGTDGALISRPHCGLEDIVTGTATNTDGSSTSCIAASGAGIKNYLTSVILANTSATAITVDIKDGSTTKFTLPLPAGSGCIFNPPVPIPGSANTAWSFDPSAAASTVTCSMVGFKSKV